MFSISLMLLKSNLDIHQKLLKAAKWFKSVILKSSLTSVVNGIQQKNNRVLNNPRITNKFNSINNNNSNRMSRAPQLSVPQASSSRLWGKVVTRRQLSREWSKRKKIINASMQSSVDSKWKNCKRNDQIFLRTISRRLSRPRALWLRESVRYKNRRRHVSSRMLKYYASRKKTKLGNDLSSLLRWKRPLRKTTQSPPWADKYLWRKTKVLILSS